MAEGSAAGAAASAGTTSQGQAGSEGSTQQTTQVAESQKTEVKSETDDTGKAKKSVEKSEVINTDVKDSQDGEKKEEPKEEKKKHKWHDRLTKEYPDQKFEKDEDYESGLEKYVGDLESYRERGTTANQKLIALFDSEPAVGEVVRDMINGATFREALARHISPDELSAVEGDPDYENWNKNKTSREESLKKRKESESQREQDLKSSLEAIETFAKENNLDDTAAETFLKRIDEMIGAMSSGKISKDNLLAMQRAFNYDNDIAKAKEEGLLAGRNEKIVAKKEEPEKKGDGIPRLNKTQEKEARREQPSYMDDILERVRKKQVIE